MAHNGKAEISALELPTAILSPTDVNRVKRELESLEDNLHQLTLRAAGKPTTLPRTSLLLEAIASDNQLNLLRPADRDRIRLFLIMLQIEAPVIHISFASDPSAAFRTKIISWLRSNIHPQIMLTFGLQPSIAAGCIVRSANRQWDFSLRARFDNHQSLLRTTVDATNSKVGT